MYYAYIYTHIYEKLFSETCTPSLALVLQARFILDWRSSSFGKELFVYGGTRVELNNSSNLIV